MSCWWCFCEGYQRGERMGGQVFFMSVLFMNLQAATQRPLPALAFRSAILRNPYTAESIQTYARQLKREYPEQAYIISDIAIAAQLLTTNKDRMAIRRQLVDLERYLETSR